MNVKMRLVAAAALFAVSLVVVGNASAGLFRFQAAEPTPAADTTLLAPSAEAVVVGDHGTSCAPKYCITYRKHCLRRHVCCDPCTPPIKMVLQINDPCSCCPIDVPVCVPGCCTGSPCVTTRCGLFGRTITDYTWCCGFKVRIILTRRGTIIVHTYGA